MRIALTMAMAVATITPAHARTLYQTTSGAVFSNADTVAQLAPQVVVDYLLHCAYNTIEELEDLPSTVDCLFDNYFALQFPDAIIGNVCSPPEMELEEITAMLEAANALCADDFTSHIDAAAEHIAQVYEAESCWTGLCADDDDSGEGGDDAPEDVDDKENGCALSRVESYFLESCSGVDLPYPLVGHLSDMSSDAAMQDDTTLTCMLDYVMSNPASDFGFEEPPVQCYPPAYDSLEAVCLSSLAIPAYNACTGSITSNAAVDDDGGEWLNLSVEDDFSMSMSMSMSMPTDDDEDDEGDMLLLERFCSILDGLATGEGLECLDIICTGDLTKSPSSMPSEYPSMAPSFMPSASPSKIDSSKPSTAPSTAPSAAPSNSPSASPSTQPSASPSTQPSASPTSSPSATPSSSPSAFPTGEEVQKVVEVRVNARVSLNLPSASGLPDQLAEVVEDGIVGSLPDLRYNDVVVTVLKVDGKAVRRRLQSSVPVEFLAVATTDCYRSDCSTMAEDMNRLVNKALSDAVEDGTMTESIRDQAESRDLDELASVDVVESSYEYVESFVALNDPETTESSGALSLTVTSAIALMVLSLTLVA